MSRPRRLFRPALTAALVAALLYASYRGGSALWVRDQLARARAEIAAGDLLAARARLGRLDVLRPGSGEILHELGLCEWQSGRPGRALEAWAQIGPDDPMAAAAARSRDQLLRRLLDDGRFSELEELLREQRRRDGPAGAEAGQTLVRLLRFEGRFEEVGRLLREEYPRAPDPSRTLRDLWMLDAEPVPVEMVRGVLERARARSPDDDRVTLGLANLATWSGALDEADRLLDSCQARRPRDPAVWRARLRWARAAGRADRAAEALERLPTEALDDAERWEWRAWFARGRGDRRAEREALERVVELVPGHGEALDRLASLAVEAGETDRAGLLRRRKDYVDRARELYRKTLAPEVERIDLATAGRVAESLGRWFESAGWWSLVERFAPGNREAKETLARLARRREHALGPPPTSTELAAWSLDDREPGLVVPRYTDDAERSGLRFTFDSGASDARLLPETMAGGVGLLDFDGDGWLDVYCIQGGPFPSAGLPSGDRLFRNRGDGTFEDASVSSGIAGFPGGYGHGVAVGDFDNDGRPDLFLTRWRSYALYRNRGDGTFEDVTEAAGLGGDRDWPTSAAWADLDGDGDLDLYVCHYLDFDPARPPACGKPGPDGGLVPEYCDPRKFPSMPDHLFRNDNGRFTDVTAEAGMADEDGRGLGVVAADLDRDGRVDLYVANDTTANFLYRNLGGMRFEEVGVAAGVASGASGGFQAGMGVACGDVDGDGLPDLAVTNFYGESTTLYRNLGGGMFEDRTAVSGLGAASRPLLGFGAVFLDADDDSRLDLATANGHVNDYRPTVPYAMPTQLILGRDGGRLVDATRQAGDPWSNPRVGRGLVAGDLDNDGRMDLLVVSHDLPLAYLRHELVTGARSLTLALEGVGSNRDAVGARVAVVAGGRRQVGQRSGGGSYLSASDPRLHFGLGDATTVEAVEVQWPSGRLDRFEGLAPGGGYRLREGEPRPTPLPGFRPAPGDRPAIPGRP